MRKLLVVLVFVVGLCAGCVFGAADPAPPDVDGISYSSDVQTADQRATALGGQWLTALQQAMPWATELAESTVDFCRTVRAGGFGHTGWDKVMCERVEIDYRAFGGDIRQRLGQIDAVVADAGFTPGPGTLVSEFNRLLSAPSGVSQVDNDVVERYERPGFPGPAIELSVTWNPAVPWVPESRDGLPGRTGPDPKPFTTATYLTWRPLAAKPLAQQAYHSHRCVMALAFVEYPYYVEP
ncbi:hypothetical protein AB0L41_46665 [Amycolatopsis mediterranei]|uniref:hypothetical protein n=1 Tax=Amycolatopsis mediterranei TaxID=33910 RepID=UPI00343A1702